MPVCARCNLEKPLSEFGWRKQKNRPQSYCRDCKKIINQEHYQQNKPSYMARSQKRRAVVTPERLWFVYEYLSTHPCVDCGESDPIVLEFDHVADKKFNVSARLRDGSSFQFLKDEIAKCEVRCANCHRRRHAAESKQWKFLAAQVGGR